MLNYYAAEEIVNKICPDQKILDAWEMEDKFLFSTAPEDWPDDEPYMVGTIFMAIRKEDGAVFEYDILEDPDAFLEAEKIV